MFIIGKEVITIKEDLTGKTFGELTVIKISDKKVNRNRMWECKCSCGITTYVLAASLRAGYYKSCGCRRIEKRDKGVSQHIANDKVDGTRKSALKAKLHKGNKSGHKGVIWLESRQKWRAYIGFKGKQLTLGYFDKKDDAIATRKQAEEKYHKPILEDNNG